MAQSLKLKLVPLTQNLGQLGPPKKRINFDIVLFPTLLLHLDTMVPSALKANNFSGPPAIWSSQTCFGPLHMCGDFEDRHQLSSTISHFNQTKLLQEDLIIVTLI